MIVIPSRGTTGFQCVVNRNILKQTRKMSEDVHDLVFALLHAALNHKCHRECSLHASKSIEKMFLKIKQLKHTSLSSAECHSIDTHAHTGGSKSARSIQVRL